MADFTMPEQVRLLLDGLRAFVRAEVEPREVALRDELAHPYDRDGRYLPPILEARRQIRMASANAGYYAMFVPPEVGGGGADFTTYYYAWEGLFRDVGPARPLPFGVLAHWAMGPSPLHRHLDAAVRAGFVGPLVRGEESSCFALSEPDAGSDVWNIRTRAVRDGDGWRIIGTKQWISNSPYAEKGIVFAVTDPDAAAARRAGVSAFVFETGQPGFHVDSVIRLFGHEGGEEGIVSFDELAVPDAYRLSPVDAGFPLALEGVNYGRLYNGARSVGLARWALERSVEYSRQRETFGKPIGQHQAIQLLLADCAMETYAARCMGLHCAWKVDQGERALKELSMMKAFSTETCFRVYDRAMQVHGGMGLTNETRLHGGLHESRIIRIADGTQEILRRTIAQELLKGDLDL
jgi:acyl-CoA dehydrogenase